MAFRTNKTPVLQEKSASGSVATFNTALAMPLSSCNIAVNAWQEGSGDPSPVNVRPIHGFDKLHIGMVDFNQLYDFTKNSTRWKNNGTVTRTWNNGVLTVSNGNTNSAYTYQEFSETVGHKLLYICEAECVKDEGASLYGALSIYAGTGTTNITRYFTNEKAIYSGIFEGINTATNRLQLRPNYTQNIITIYRVMIVDLTEMFGSKIADYLYNLETQTTGAGVALFKQIFYKDYYAYNAGGTWVSVASVNGDSYPDYAEIQLGQEVYGAEVDAVNGVARISHYGYVCNNDTILTLTGSGTGLRAISIDYATNNLPQMKSGAQGQAISNLFSKNIPSGAEGRLSAGATTAFFLIDTSRLSTADSAGALEWAVNNQLTFVYPIETPIEISLSDIPTISTLIGNNTIFADTGDIDLTYKDLDLAKRGNFREVFKLPS